MINSLISEGKIVPAEITVGLMKEKMESEGKDKIHLIDGFPRNQDNINAWYKVFDGSEGKKAKILCLLNLECSEKICEERLINRSLTSGRSDDAKEVIKKRFLTYKNESVIVIEKMRELKNKVISINAEGKPEDIFDDAMSFLKEFLC